MRTQLALALAALALACDRPAPTAIADAGTDPATFILPYDPDAPLQLKAGWKLEEVDEGSIRELVTIEASFTGFDPLEADAGGGPHVKDLALEFELGPTALAAPEAIRLEIAGSAWTPKGNGYRIEVQDPQLLPTVIEALKIREGQPDVDLTGELAGLEGRLRFHPNAKAWSLGLELTGIVTPSDVIAPMFHPLVGAVEASLEGGGSLLPAGIREAETRHVSPELEVKVAARIEELDGGGIREVVETSYLLRELNPVDGQTGSPSDLDIRLARDGDSGSPFYMRLIPSEAWLDGGDFFKFEAVGPNDVPAVIQILFAEEGQVLGDLTPEIHAIQSRLGFSGDLKGWLLEIELVGVGAAAGTQPCWMPMAGSGFVALLAGDGGAEAGIREGEAVFY